MKTLECLLETIDAGNVPLEASYHPDEMEHIVIRPMPVWITLLRKCMENDDITTIQESPALLAVIVYKDDAWDGLHKDSYFVRSSAEASNLVYTKNNRLIPFINCITVYKNPFYGMSELGIDLLYNFTVNSKNIDMHINNSTGKTPYITYGQDTKLGQLLGGDENNEYIRLDDIVLKKFLMYRSHDYPYMITTSISQLVGIFEDYSKTLR